MDWGYVAGYFDGEGHVSLWTGKDGQLSRSLRWYNTHQQSLAAISRFIEAGHINCSRRDGTPCYVLKVSRRADLARVLGELVPRLLVKRAAAEMLLESLTGMRDQSVGWGRIAATSTEQLSAWYHEEKKTYAGIASLLGVTIPAVCTAFRRRGIPARPAGGAYTRGIPKSEATKQRMRAAQQRRRHGLAKGLAEKFLE